MCSVVVLLVCKMVLLFGFSCHDLCLCGLGIWWVSWGCVLVILALDNMLDACLVGTWGC